MYIKGMEVTNMNLDYCEICGWNNEDGHDQCCPNNLEFRPENTRDEARAERRADEEGLAALDPPQCSICREYHPNDDRHPCE